MWGAKALGEDAILNKFPGRAFLLAAGGEDRPDSFRPLTSPFGAGALGDLAVNDNSADRLLGQIVGGSNPWIIDEAQVRTPVLVQAVGNVLRFSWKLFFRSKSP